MNQQQNKRFNPGNFRPISLKAQITLFQLSRLLNITLQKTIENLNPNKSHGYDMIISIRMLKTCGDSILKPLELIFKSFIESEKFPNWKKAIAAPVHKE